MEKKFSKFELARIKRTAQNVNQYIERKNKLVAKIAELQTELTEVEKLIELTDAPTVAMTGGYGTEDIIKKVVTVTDKVDKKGNLIKQTTFEFKYPDTIIPPTQEAEAAPTAEEETVNIDSEAAPENESEANDNNYISVNDYGI